MQRRLETLFQEPGLKIGDVILSVGDDEEMMEVVRKWSEENNNPPASEHEEMGSDQRSLREQITSYEEELNEIMADMRLMRDQQSVGCPEDRKEILLNMMADLEISIREDDTKLERLHSDVEQALLTERFLKEQINKHKEDGGK